MAPIVSVVMTVFNGGKFLRDAIESILAQTLYDFEFIIIDDGSADGSAQLIDSYQRRDPRVRVYRQQNRAPNESDTCRVGEALNRGCTLAQGKYIARMDADDIALRDRLLWQLDFMEKHPEVGLIGGAVEWIDSDGNSHGIHRNPVEDEVIKTTLLYNNVFWHPTVVFRKHAFVSTGGYRDIVAAEDYDLWLRFADRFQLANLETVLLKYRIHAHQVSVRKRSQQSCSALAVRGAALARRNGNPDPLDSCRDLTPAKLARILEQIVPAIRAGGNADRGAQGNLIPRPHLRWIYDLSHAIAEGCVEEGGTPNECDCSNWFATANQLEESLHSSLSNENERNRVLAWFFVTLADKLRLRRDNLSDVKTLYRLALKHDKRALKVYAKLLLFLTGKPGEYVRGVIHSLRTRNLLVQLGEAQPEQIKPTL
jgi:hypothetical protein